MYNRGFDMIVWCICSDLLPIFIFRLKTNVLKIVFSASYLNMMNATETANAYRVKREYLNGTAVKLPANRNNNSLNLQIQTFDHFLIFMYKTRPLRTSWSQEYFNA